MPDTPLQPRRPSTDPGVDPFGFSAKSNDWPLVDVDAWFRQRLAEGVCCTDCTPGEPCGSCFDTGHAHDPADPCPAQSGTFAPEGWDDKTESPVDEQAESLAKAEPPPPETSVVAECACWVTPERDWFTHMGAVEPGSQWEPNPDCPVHFPHGGWPAVDAVPDAEEKF